MMSNSGNIIDVSESDFEFQVIAYSQQVPVVVDFWAEWCAPCRLLGPILEKLAEEAGGAFRLAKVNVDENPNLARRFNVNSIPTVKSFNNGQMVSEFVGVLSEAQIREIIGKLLPDETTLMMEKAISLLADRDIANAEEAFREVLVDKPGSPEALLGLSKCLLFADRASEALEILRYFPVSQNMASAEAMQPLAQALANDQNHELDQDDDLAPAFHRSLLLIRRGNIPAALDGLISILSENKRYRNGEVHRIILGLFELLGSDDPLTLEYRKELANVLF